MTKKAIIWYKMQLNKNILIQYFIIEVALENGYSGIVGITE
jgi:hypothetical protein